MCERFKKNNRVAISFSCTQSKWLIMVSNSCWHFILFYFFFFSLTVIDLFFNFVDQTQIDTWIYTKHSRKHTVLSMPFSIQVELNRWLIINFGVVFLFYSIGVILVSDFHFRLHFSPAFFYFLRRIFFQFHPTFFPFF